MLRRRVTVASPLHFALRRRSALLDASLTHRSCIFAVQWGRAAMSSSTIDDSVRPQLENEILRKLHARAVRAKHVATGAQPFCHVHVKDVARDLPDDVMEAVCRVHGGLLAFLQNCSSNHPEYRALFAFEEGGRLSLAKDRGMDAVKVQRLLPHVGVPDAPAAPATATIASRCNDHIPPPPVVSRSWIRVADAQVRMPDHVASGIQAVLPSCSGGVVYDCRTTTDEDVRSHSTPTLPLFVSFEFLKSPPMRVLSHAFRFNNPSRPPEDYDAYRMGRFLSTETFVSLEELRQTSPEGNRCGDAVQDDPLWIALHNPNMFEVDDPVRPTAVRFVLDTDHQSRLGPPTKYEGHTIEELNEILKAQRKECKGLFKLIKLRKMIRRAIQRKMFPHGTPFLHSSVLAYYLYDMLPHDEHVTLSQLKESIPPSILDGCAPITEAHLVKFPHLFVVSETPDGRDSRIRRREQHEEISSNPEPLQAIQLLGLVHNALPKRFDEARPISVSVVAAKLPKLISKQVSKWLRQESFLQFPDIFRRSDLDTGEVRLFIDVAKLEKAIQELSI